MFYNDRDGERAGVLSLADGVWSVSEALQKFDPGTGSRRPRRRRPSRRLTPPRRPLSSRRRTPLSPRLRPRRPLPRDRRVSPAAGTRPSGGAASAPASSTAPPPPPARAADGRADHGVARRPDARRARDIHRDGGPCRRRDVGVVDRRRAGAPFATGADAGTFAPTLPTDQGLVFVVTLTVTTAAGAQPAHAADRTATPSTVPVISSVTSAETSTTRTRSGPSRPCTPTCHPAGASSGRSPVTARRSRARSRGPPVRRTRRRSGEPGLYRATLTITVDGRRASGSVDFKVEYVCGPSPLAGRRSTCAPRRRPSSRSRPTASAPTCSRSRSPRGCPGRRA